MKAKIRLVLINLLLLVALFAVGCGAAPDDAGESKQDSPPTSQAPEEKLKVGFVMIGNVTDGGWNTSHENGRLYLAKEMPDVETMAVEKVPDGGGDSERVMRQLIEKGAKVIFATSFGYGDSVKKLAKEFPEVYFLHCTGLNTAENLSTYDIREYEGTYLTGMVAGKMTKTNVIGYVAANPIPAVIRAVDGFAMGVKAVNPNAKVKLLWTSTWFDPAKEKDAALSLADAKADVLAQYQDSPAVQQAAQERGIYSIGYHADMRKFAPQANLTSFTWNWGPIYVKEVKAYLDGSWKGQAIWASMQEGAAEIAPLNKELVPADVKALVEETKQKLSSGQMKVFAGPVKDNKGKVIVEAGQNISDDAMIHIDWLADNVDGKL